MTVVASSEAVTGETSTSDSLYRRTWVALDSSEHANAAMHSALALTEFSENSTITDTKTNEAQRHNVRSSKMEGGLPIITDSYPDQMERNYRKSDMHFVRWWVKKSGPRSMLLKSVAEIGEAVVAPDYLATLSARRFGGNGQRRHDFANGRYS